MTSPNRTPLSKRMVLVAATAGTFVLGSAGVAFANTHDSTGLGVEGRSSVESSTSVGETTTSVENPTAPALETKTFATRGGTVVVQIDHDNHHVTLVSATPADGWTVKTKTNKGHGKRFVDVRFRSVTATDAGTTSTTDDSGHHGKDDKAFTGTEIRVRVGFAAWRLVEFVSTRTFGPLERPAAATTTTVEGSLESTSTTVDDDDQGDDNGNHGNGKDDSSKQRRGNGSDDPPTHDQADDKGGRRNDDPPTHDQGDDHGGRGQGGDDQGDDHGGNRGGGDDNGSNRGGNGGGGDDHGGRHG